MKEIILIGNGKLAEAVEKNFSRYSDIPVKKYLSNQEYGSHSIFVHIGSGRQYAEALKAGEEAGATFIQAATEKDILMKGPEGKKVRYVFAPNLDLHIVKLFSLLRRSRGLFDGDKISVVESHQQEKTSQPGTAQKICDFLNLPYDRIVSIREPEKQKKLHIENLNHHAFHRIRIGDSDSGITIETKVEGAESYVKGLATIVGACEGLDPGIYDVETLFDWN